MFARPAWRAVFAQLRFNSGHAVSQAVEVTRYPNRRLYDRSQRQYVTLGDIEEMVRNGKDVRVRDSKTQEDLTRVILIQILLERHPERVQMFPVGLLHAILRADQIALDWLTVYFGQAKSFMEALPAANAVGPVPGMDLWQLWMPAAGMPTEPPSEDLPSEDSPSEDSPEEDETPKSEQEMAARLAELERRLKQLEAGRD